MRWDWDDDEVSAEEWPRLVVTTALVVLLSLSVAHVLGWY